MQEALEQLRRGIEKFSQIPSPIDSSLEVSNLSSSLCQELSQGISPPEIDKTRETAEVITAITEELQALVGKAQDADKQVNAVMQTIVELAPHVVNMPPNVIKQVIEAAVVSPLQSLIAEEHNATRAAELLANLISQRTALEQQPPAGATRAERQRLLQQQNQDKEHFFASSLAQLANSIKEERSRLHALDPPALDVLHEQYTKFASAHNETTELRQTAASRRVTYRSDPTELEASLTTLKEEKRANLEQLLQSIQQTLALLKDHDSLEEKIRAVEQEQRIHQEVERMVEGHRKEVVGNLEGEEQQLHLALNALGRFKEDVERHVADIAVLCRHQQEAINQRLKHTVDFYSKIYEDYWIHLDELAEAKRKCILRHEFEIKRCETELAEWEHIAYEESSAAHLEKLDNELSTHKAFKETLEAELQDISRVMEGVRERGKEFLTDLPGWVHPSERIKERRWARQQKETLEGQLRRATPTPSIDASVYSTTEEEVIRLKHQLARLTEELARSPGSHRSVPRSPHHALEVVHLYEGQDVTDLGATASVVEPPSRKQLLRARQLKRAPQTRGSSFGTPPKKRR